MKPSKAQWAVLERLADGETFYILPPTRNVLVRRGWIRRPASVDGEHRPHELTEEGARVVADVRAEIAQGGDAP